MYLLVLLLGTVVCRDAIISEAATYANYTWVVNTPNPRYKIYRTKGKPITGEAYSYGDKDTRPTFQSNIDAGVMPRNWEGHSAVGYTGIDCSGLVSKCWRTSVTGVSNLVSRTLQLANKDYLKPGDVLATTGHIQIYAGNGSVYESTGWDDTEDIIHQKVIYGPANFGYDYYSIFPQFSNPQPPDGAENVSLSVDISVEIAVNATYGRINKSGVVVKVDDEDVTDFTLTPLGGGKYKVSFHWEFTGWEESPEHIVSVRKKEFKVEG